MTKNEKLLSLYNPIVVYTATDKYKWTGQLKNNDITSYTPNTFASEKNLNKWIAKIESMIVPEIEPMVELTEVKLVDVIEPVGLSRMNKDELREYALNTLKVDLDMQKTKAELILEIKKIRGN